MQLDEKDKAVIGKYGQMLSVSLRIIESSAQVNVDQYKEHCKTAYIHLINELPWVSITPTLHKLLAHSWELIALNEGEGLRRLDESGMEGCNKLLRTIRTKHSRKTSQQACNIDCLTRLWLGSDPIFQKERMKALSYCSNCKVSGHGTRYCPLKNVKAGPMSEEDAIFFSLTLHEDHS